MAWTDLDFLNVNEEITTDYLNKLARNIEYLHSGKNWVLKRHPGTGSDYTETFTSTDHAIPVDSATFKITDTFQGPVVMLMWHATVNMTNLTNNIVFGFQVDNNSIGEPHVNLNTYINSGYVSANRNILIVKPVIIEPGEHSFDIFWHSTDANTVYIKVAYRPFFAVMEM